MPSPILATEMGTVPRLPSAGRGMGTGEVTPASAGAGAREAP